jgi:hypothetical protein
MAAPVNTVAPSFTGSLRVGELLTGDAGTWEGSPTFAYQWQAAEVLTAGGEPLTVAAEILTLPFADIADADESTYTIGDYVGYMLRLKVTGTNLDGSTVAYAEQDGPVLGMGGRAATTLMESLYVSLSASLLGSLLEDED